MPMTCTLSEMDAPEMDACGMYAYEMHAYEIDTSETHTYEMHAYEMHAHEIHFAFSTSSPKFSETDYATRHLVQHFSSVFQPW